MISSLMKNRPPSQKSKPDCPHLGISIGRSSFGISPLLGALFKGLPWTGRKPWSPTFLRLLQLSANSTHTFWYTLALTIVKFRMLG